MPPTTLSNAPFRNILPVDRESRNIKKSLGFGEVATLFAVSQLDIIKMPYAD